MAIATRLASGACIVACAALVASGCTSTPETVVVDAQLEIPGATRLTALVASDEEVIVATTGAHPEVRLVDVAPDGSIPRVQLVRAPDAVSAVARHANDLLIAVADPKSEIHRVRLRESGRHWTSPLLNLPGNPAVRALHARASRLYVGTSSDPTHEELLAVDLGALGPRLVARAEVGADVDAIAATRARVEVTTPSGRLAFLAARLDRDGDVAPRDEAARLPSTNGAVEGRVVGSVALPPRYVVVSAPTAASLRLSIVTVRRPLAVDDANGDGVVKIACTGDSNTAFASRRPKWCEYLKGLIEDPRVRIVNVAEPGATAVKRERPTLSDQLPRALQAGADAVVMAFGTNDTNLNVAARPEEVVAAYRAAWNAVLESGADPFIALTPPRYNFDDAQVRAVNERIREAFPAERLIDFYAIGRPEDFSHDGIHVLPSGQRARARAAYSVLTAAP